MRGVGHQCDTCGAKEVFEYDLLSASSLPMPSGWFYAAAQDDSGLVRYPMKHFCSAACLAAWAAEQ